MANLGYAQQLKQQQVHVILYVIKEAGECHLDILLQEMFDKRGLSPSTVKRYLKELVELGKIKMDELDNKVSIINGSKEQAKTESGEG